MWTTRSLCFNAPWTERAAKGLVCVTYSVPVPEHSNLIHLSHSVVPCSSSIIQDPRDYVVLICINCHSNFWHTELDNLTLVCMGRSLFSLSPTWFAHSGICAIVQASSTLLWISLIPSQTCTSICQTWHIQHIRWRWQHGTKMRIKNILWGLSLYTKCNN